MTNRPTPARIARRRRHWALPFARAMGRQVDGEESVSVAPVAAPSVPVSRDEDFLRRLREAGL